MKNTLANGAYKIFRWRFYDVLHASLFLLVILTGFLLASCAEEDGSESLYASDISRFGKIEISIDGSPAGTITTESSSPTCGGGEITKTMEPGWHEYTAKASEGGEWGGLIYTVSGECGLNDVVDGLDIDKMNGVSNQGTITVRSQTIQVCVADWDAVDGDIITISVNNRLVASKVELTDIEKCYNPYKLVKGANWINIVTNDPGTEGGLASPRVEVNDGKSIQVFQILSGVDDPGGYVINVVL